MGKSGYRHLARDPVMAGLIKRFGKLPLAADLCEPYVALCRSVIYQQLHATAASAIMGRLIDQVGAGVMPAPQLLLASSDEALRGVGLSRNKIAALRDLATHALDGLLPTLTESHKLSDHELQKRLCQIRGIGPWTVEMFLIFTLGRPDVLPCGDLGVQRGYRVAYNLDTLPTPRQLAQLGAEWAPHRSLAALYLWRVADDS